MDIKISLALICAVMVFSFTCGSPVVHTRDNKITAECNPGYTWCEISETCCETEKCQNGYCYVYQAAAAGKRKKVKQSFELEDDVRSSLKSCPQRGYIWCSNLRKCCPACGLTSCITRQDLPLKSTCPIPCIYDQNSCCNSDEVCLRTGCHPNLDSNLPAFVPSRAYEEDRLSAPLKSSCDIFCRFSPNGCCNFNEICLQTGCYSKVPVLGPPATNEEDRLSAPLKSNSCNAPGDTWCSHLGKCCRYGTACGEHSCINRLPTPHKSQSGPFANEKEKDDFTEIVDATNEEYEEFDLQ